MHPILALVLTHTLYYGSVAVDYAKKAGALLWKAWLSYYQTPIEIAPKSRYFMNYPVPTQDMEAYLTVPEGAIYIEEWVRNGIKKCVLKYEGETIPRSWTESPFDRIPRTPWVWVGDRETEIDLTRTFGKFLVVGNRITTNLVKSILCVTPKTRLIYIEAGTFKELKFPGDGLTIEEYGSVQDRRPVYRTEEAVPPPVVGGRNDSVERDDSRPADSVLPVVPGKGGCDDDRGSSDKGTPSVE